MAHQQRSRAFVIYRDVDAVYLVRCWIKPGVGVQVGTRAEAREFGYFEKAARYIKTHDLRRDGWRVVPVWRRDENN